MSQPIIYGIATVFALGTGLLTVYVGGIRLAHKSYGILTRDEARQLWAMHKQYEREEWWMQRRNGLEKMKKKFISGSKE